MTVSVKITSYNHAPYIAQTIESILAQKTNFPVELIIGDDASTDGTADIIHDYALRYPQIKAVLRKTNLGMVGNVFDLDSQISGEYIAFCDGDDYWEDPYKLQKQVDFIKDHQDYAIVYSNVYQLLEQKGIMRKQPVESHSGYVLKELINSAFMATATVLLRASAYFEVRESVLMAITEHKLKMIDYPLWLEVARNHKIYHINEYSVVYRVLEESASHSGDPTKQLAFDKSVLDVVNYYANKFNLEQEVERSVTKRLLRIYRRSLIHRLDDKPLYRKAFLKSKAVTGKGKIYKFMARFWLTEGVLGLFLRLFMKK